MKEIYRLKEMLEKANIPFEWIVKPLPLNKCQIIILKDDIRLCDAIQGYGTYGIEKDLIEIMGALTLEEGNYDDVLGWLTAEEVFKRFKFCYENNTSIYEKEDKINE